MAASYRFATWTRYQRRSNCVIDGGHSALGASDASGVETGNINGGQLSGDGRFVLVKDFGADQAEAASSQGSEYGRSRAGVGECIR